MAVKMKNSIFEIIAAVIILRISKITEKKESLRLWKFRSNNTPDLT
jgi:hypothetical protein